MLSDKEKIRLEKVRLHLANGTNPYSKDEIKTVAVGEKREPIERPRIEHVVPSNVSERKGMTEQEELYAKFYAKGKLLVAEMDVTQLREHRETLAQIAFEAKATLAAADDELRERKAKTSVKAKEWLVTPTGPDQTTSDAINAVKVRKDRMSKMDKLRSDLLRSLDEATVNEMMSQLERKATEKNLKAVTFTKPTTEQGVVTVQVAKPVQDNGEVKPLFNPSSLSFGSK